MFYQTTETSHLVPANLSIPALRPLTSVKVTQNSVRRLPIDNESSFTNSIKTRSRRDNRLLQWRCHLQKVEQIFDFIQWSID